MLLLLSNRSGAPGGRKKTSTQSMPIGMGLHSLIGLQLGARSFEAKIGRGIFEATSPFVGLFSVQSQAALSPADQGHSFCHIEMLFLSSMTTLHC
jgi:hypothetical protein